MPTPESLVDLKASIEEFTSKITTDYGDVISGKVAEVLNTYALNHTTAVGSNIHQTTPIELNVYSKTEYVDVLAEALDNDVDMPLSFFGDQEYVLPAVDTSYGGGATPTPWGMVGMLLEDNGTLMLLRTCVNNAALGVYYSYLRDATRCVSMGDVVNTNVAYRPSYFPANRKAIAVLYNNRDVMIGVMADATTGARAGYFISLLNNTFDMSKHTGIIVPEGGAINVTTLASGALGGLPVGYLNGTKCVLLVKLDWDGSQAGWRVWEFLKSDLVANTYVAPTRITGWTIDRGVAGSFSYPDIILATAASQYLVSTDANVTVGMETSSNPSTQVITSSVGVVSISTALQVKFTDALARSPVKKPHLIFTFDIPDTKIIDLSPFFAAKVSVGFNIPTASFTVTKPAQMLYDIYSPVDYQGAYDGDKTQRLSVANNQAFTCASAIDVIGHTLSRIDFPVNATWKDIQSGASQGGTATTTTLTPTTVPAPVPDKWMVYLPTSSAMVDGKYGNLAVYPIALDPVTDANKVFNVWVVRRVGQSTLEYVLTADMTPPIGSSGSLYIGSIVTNGSGVVSNSVHKRVAVGGYQISNLPQGGSIPVTVGNPQVLNDLSWR